MKAECLLILPERVSLPRCEAIRSTNYYNDTSTTNKRCVRHSRYKIDGKHYCKPHASVKALEILLEAQ